MYRKSELEKIERERINGEMIDKINRFMVENELKKN